MILAFSQRSILLSNTLDGIALIVIGVAILVGWGLVWWKQRANVLQNNPRFGYLVGDVFLLVPGCIVAGWGLLANAPWGAPLLLIAVGAAAFDLTHTLIYTAEIAWPRPGGKILATWLYALAILVVLAILEWIGWSDIVYLVGSTIPIVFFWGSGVLAVVFTVAVSWGAGKVRQGGLAGR